MSVSNGKGHAGGRERRLHGGFVAQRQEIAT
jgi:hypothetical protein